MATFRDLLADARARITETDPAGAEALLAEGHLLLESVPGLAKTLATSSSTSASRTSSSRGRFPARCTFPGATWSPASRTG